MRFGGTLRSGIESVMSLWRTWNIHGFLLSSLLVQLILFFAAPLRKKTTRLTLVGLVWSLYQLAETLLTHALSNLKSAASRGRSKAEDARDLYTLWAVCMLLHYGGPDSITALSMEDNFLWQRTMSRFLGQLSTTAIIAMAVKPGKVALQHPYILVCSLLILGAGIVKSVERILCQRGADPTVFGRFLVERNPEPGPDYAAIVEEHNFYKERGVPVEFVEKINNEPSYVGAAAATADGPLQVLNDAQLVQQAYRFYSKFKGTFVDRVFCCHDRMEARGVFLHLSPQAAFSVVETEMKFAFEAFYTKSHLFANPWLERTRFLSFFFEAAALCLWLHTMHLFQSVEALVTTCLLAGAVLIDIIAFLRLYLSDWKIAQSAAANTFSQSWITLLFGPFLCMRRRRWGEYPQVTSCFHKFLRTLFSQWSESIPQFNFIDYCIRKRPDWRNTLYTYLGAKGMMDDRRYVTRRWLTNHLRKFIIEELQHKSNIAGNLNGWEEVNSSRGGWILRYNASADLEPATFDPYISEVEYDESVLMWHIATEILYQTEETPGDDEMEQKHRTFSKFLSDYMLYLSVRQPKLMSELVPMADVIFKASCKEARRLLLKAMPVDHKGACKRIVQVGTHIHPSFIKEEDDNSVLFDASLLAQRLKMVKRNRWKLVSQIWVELLCYAAVRTPGIEHAVLLSQGGELVTLVRLLVLHLGLSDQFRVAKNIPRAELVVVES